LDAPDFVNDPRNPLLLGIYTAVRIGLVTIELKRKHALLFTLLFAMPGIQKKG
jgi:hypothetical protein